MAALAISSEWIWSWGFRLFFQFARENRAKASSSGGVDITKQDLKALLKMTLSLSTFVITWRDLRSLSSPLWVHQVLTQVPESRVCLWFSSCVFFDCRSEFNFTPVLLLAPLRFCFAYWPRKRLYSPETSGMFSLHLLWIVSFVVCCTVLSWDGECLYNVSKISMPSSAGA